jgi:tRNA modification GTPase
MVESIGVERAKRAMADADLTVILLDGSQHLTAEDKEIIAQAKNLNYIIAINKKDLEQKFSDIAIEHKTLKISAKTGEGLEDLQKAVVEPFSSQNFENTGFLISDARHNDLLLRSKSEIENSILFINEKASEEIIVIGLHNAMRFLGEITGETTTEDMLTRIFSTFCIGK